MALGDILGGFAKGFGQGISDVATLSLEDEIRKKGEQRKLEMAEASQRKKKNESLAFYEDMFGAEQGKTDLERVTNIMTAARDAGVNIGFGPDNTLTANRMTPQELALHDLKKRRQLTEEELQVVGGAAPTESQAMAFALRPDIGQGEGGVAFADEQQTQPFERIFGGGSNIQGRETGRTPDVWLTQVTGLLKPGEGIPEVWEDFQAEFPGISFEQFTQLLKKQRLPDGNPLVSFGEQPKPVPPPFKKQIETLFGVNPKHLKYP